jgi:hypothetical protein
MKTLKKESTTTTFHQVHFQTRMTLISKELEDIYCHSFETTNFILHPTTFPGFEGGGEDAAV